MEAIVTPAQGLWVVGTAIVFMVCAMHITKEKPKEVEVRRIVSLGKRLDNGKPLSFEFGLNSHTLFAGETGFGKSNEINYLLSQLAVYPDVQFLIGNAKGGSDFLQWLPRAMSLGVGPESTDMLVDEALAILRQRYADLVPDADLDTAYGMHLLMTSQRKVTISNDLPLIVLVVDEFIEYLKGRTVGVQRAAKLHTLITTGRAVGMVVILATQRPSQYSAPTDLRENIPYHCAFRMDKYGTEMVFGRGSMAEIPLNEITIPGHGYAMVPGIFEPVPFIAPEADEAYCSRIAWQSARLRKSIQDLPILNRDSV